MTQEEKELLLKDLCTRSPYLVKGVLSYDKDKEIFTIKGYDIEREVLYLSNSEGCHIDDFKPYLRPMSSMTEEEKSTYLSYCECDDGDYTGEILYFDTIESFDYLNQIHIDYRNLIPRGLALEASKDMYNNKPK